MAKWYSLLGDNANTNRLKLLLKAPKKPVYNALYVNDLYKSPEESLCCFSDISSLNKRTKFKRVNYRKNQPSNVIATNEYIKIMAKQCSLPNVHASIDKETSSNRRNSEMYLNTSTPFKTKYIVNAMSLYPKKVPSNCLKILGHPLTQAQLRIQGCQQRELSQICCCPCNSDAVFEVVSALYDCHNKNSCEQMLINENKAPMTKKVKKVALKKVKDDLLYRETLTKRKPTTLLSQERKPNSINAVTKCTGLPPKQKPDVSMAKTGKPYYCQLIPPLEGKASIKNVKNTLNLRDLNLDLKQKYQRNEMSIKNSENKLIDLGLHVEDKIALDKKIVKEIRKELGLPAELKTNPETPRYFKAQAIGRKSSLEESTTSVSKPTMKTSVENKLSTNGLVEKRNGVKKAVQELPREKPRRSKADRVVSFSKDNALSRKEKLIRAILDYNVPLSKSVTSSERNFITKIRKTLVLQPQQITGAQRIKFATVKVDRWISTLRDKTNREKLKLYRLNADQSIIPEDRKNSGKKLIKKVKREMGLPPPPIIVIEGKKYATAEAFKMLNIRKHIGLSPVPITLKQKEKCTNAQLTGFIKPLEGINAADKKNILKDLTKIGIALPEGKINTEKTLISKVKNETIANSLMKHSNDIFEKPCKKDVIDRLPLLAKNKRKQKEKPDYNTFIQSETDKRLINKTVKDMSLPPNLAGCIVEKENHLETEKLISTLEAIAQLKTLPKPISGTGVTPSEDRSTSPKLLIDFDCSETAKMTPRILPPKVLKQIDKLTKKVAKDSDRCKNNLLTSFVDKVRPVRPRTALKMRTHILKEGPLKGTSVVNEYPSESKKASKKKIINKATAAIKNLRKAQEKIIGGVAVPGDNICEKHDPDWSMLSTAFGKYAGSLKVEATNLCPTFNSTEYMTTAQKSIIQVLSTYLARVEVELLME